MCVCVCVCDGAHTWPPRQHWAAFIKEQGASVSLMCVLHVYVHEFVCLFSECFACVLTRVCIIILGCFIMCRLCRHQGPIHTVASECVDPLRATDPHSLWMGCRHPLPNWIVAPFSSAKDDVTPFKVNGDPSTLTDQRIPTRTCECCVSVTTERAKEWTGWRKDKT